MSKRISGSEVAIMCAFEWTRVKCAEESISAAQTLRKREREYALICHYARVVIMIIIIMVLAVESCQKVKLSSSSSYSSSA